MAAKQAQELNDKYKALMGNAGAEGKAKEQTGNDTDSPGNESAEKKAGDDLEPAEVKTTQDESADQTTDQDSKRGSTSNGEISEQKWGDLEGDDTFNPETPPGWKTQHADNKKSDSQADGDKAGNDKTAKRRKPNPDPINTEEARPSSAPSTPVVIQTEKGEVTLDTMNGVIGGPVTQTQPLDPQVMEWAIQQVKDLLPVDDKSARKILENAVTKNPGEAGEYLQDVLGTEPDALNLITELNNKRCESGSPSTPRPAKHGAFGGMGKVNPYDNKPPKKGAPHPPGTSKGPQGTPRGIPGEVRGDGRNSNNAGSPS
ncbi:hypothetical protein N0V87_000090 [Didymella glomerata]|uniref:Uncharacterized protein n=1 Tax=Didymella glomerata TaxID=749621 RepID=A0A9W8X8E0_9PLEO|nr:hypothetical protein N0V87_000090 [Didymella glomerata]